MSEDDKLCNKRGGFVTILALKQADRPRRILLCENGNPDGSDRGSEDAPAQRQRRPLLFVNHDRAYPDSCPVHAAMQQCRLQLLLMVE